MAQSIHISTLRKMLKAGDPVDLKLWTKSGEIQEWRNCVPLRYNFYKGTQQFKLLNSGQIRQARICCIFSVNNLEIFYKEIVAICNFLYLLLRLMTKQEV